MTKELHVSQKGQEALLSSQFTFLLQPKAHYIHLGSLHNSKNYAPESLCGREIHTQGYGGKNHVRVYWIAKCSLKIHVHLEPLNVT